MTNEKEVDEFFNSIVSTETRLKRQAEQGFAEAQYQYSELIFEDQTKTDYAEKSLKWLRKAAKQGHAESQLKLGYCYQYCHGIKRKNIKKAFEWYEKSAKQGNAKAQNKMGVCYYYGEGVKKDLNKAFEWVKKSEKQGDPDAKENLAKLRRKLRQI